MALGVVTLANLSKQTTTNQPKDLEMLQLVTLLRTAIYSPLRVLDFLNVDPAHYLGLIDFLVNLDEPLRVYLVGKQPTTGTPTSQPQ